MAGLEGLDAVKAHPGGAAPDDDVAVLEEDAARGIGAQKAAEKEDAVQAH